MIKPGPCDCQAGYKNKLEKLGGLEDPYLHCGQEIREEDWRNWPHVEYPNILNFLIKCPSHECIGAYD